MLKLEKKNFTMKKSTRKTVFTLCIALAIFMCNSAFVFAAVCNSSPDGVHHYTKCADADAGQLREGGSYLYLDGYDKQNRPIHKECHYLCYYRYCNNVCTFCGTIQEGGLHDHLLMTFHSVDHN